MHVVTHIFHVVTHSACVELQVLVCSPQDTEDRILTGHGNGRVSGFVASAKAEGDISGLIEGILLAASQAQSHLMWFYMSCMLLCTGRLHSYILILRYPKY